MTTFAPAPAVKRTAPGEIGVSWVFPLTDIEATFSPAGTASLTRIREPGWVATGKLQPALPALLPAVEVTVCRPTVKLDCAPCSPGVALHVHTFDRRGGLRVRDRDDRCTARPDGGLDLGGRVRSRTAMRPCGETAAPVICHRPLLRSS